MSNDPTLKEQREDEVVEARATIASIDPDLPADVINFFSQFPPVLLVAPEDHQSRRLNARQAAALMYNERRYAVMVRQVPVPSEDSDRAPSFQTVLEVCVSTSQRHHLTIFRPVSAHDMLLDKAKFLPGPVRIELGRQLDKVRSRER